DELLANDMLGFLRGHTSSVISVAFSPDGKTLASDSIDGIRLWDVTTRQPLGTSLVSSPFVGFSVVFSPDGKTLASGSFDGFIYLWDTDAESWMARACRIAGRNLTKQEWDQFIGTRHSYHRTCTNFPPGDGVQPELP